MELVKHKSAYIDFYSILSHYLGDLIIFRSIYGVQITSAAGLLCPR